MFSVRSRLFSRLAMASQSRLVENAPKVAAVKLFHVLNSANGLMVKPQLVHPAWRDVRIVRLYSTDTPSQAEVEVRVLNVCKAFDKITADKVSLSAHFVNDLGLDSLDHVEVIMAMEDEFGFEIPDEHAEKLVTPELIVKYVLDHSDA